MTIEIDLSKLLYPQLRQLRDMFRGACNNASTAEELAYWRTHLASTEQEFAKSREEIISTINEE
jgi:hypothetical protein